LQQGPSWDRASRRAYDDRPALIGCCGTGYEGADHHRQPTAGGSHVGGKKAIILCQAFKGESGLVMGWGWVMGDQLLQMVRVPEFKCYYCGGRRHLGIPA
jgi:hypothetical protein